MPYGKKEDVDRLIRDMSAQKHKLKLWKVSEDESADKIDIQEVWIEGAVRLLPFGVMEYVFPKEDKDVVLTTLNFHKEAPYNLTNAGLFFIRKALKATTPGKFDTNNHLLWIKNNVSIIPIGIREDVDIKEEDTGYYHEGL